MEKRIKSNFVNGKGDTALWSSTYFVFRGIKAASEVFNAWAHNWLRNGSNFIFLFPMKKTSLKLVLHFQLIFQIIFHGPTYQKSSRSL